MACLLISSVLSASFRMPVNQSGNSPREPEFVDGTGGCPWAGDAPIGEPPVFNVAGAASDIFGGTCIAGACCIFLTCSGGRSEEHTSELQSQSNLVCRLLLEKKKTTTRTICPS